MFFIEPLQRNQPALGYDLNARLDTLARARDTGEATATPPSELIQEQQHEPGFIVYLPIFAGPAPATIAERRLVNTGFVAAVFRIADLVGPALARQPGLRVTLRDATAAAAPVVYSVPAADAATAEERLSACDFSLPFAGREWRITFTPTTGFVAGGPVWQSWAALVVGVALTALLTGYLLASSRRATEIAQANAALQAEVVERQRAEATAAAASQAKSEFVASLSHEIRTPLNSILGYTQILERDASLSLHQGEAVRALANSGQHLLGLLNSILDFSKIEAGRMELQCDAFSPAALVQGVAEMFKLSCWEKRLTLRVDCPEDGPPHVLGDEGKLRQVLINLLGNAIKFTPQGEVCVSARLGSGGQWRFEIVDTGIGMTAEECAGLFAPFHQTVVGRRHGGTGLGLAIARGHIELMGGNIAVQSESGRGSRFSFYLPLLTAEVAKRTAAGGVFWPQPVLSPSCVTPSVTTSALLSSTEFEDIVLPEDLCARMSEAAELHSTTVVKACLEELRQLGGPAVPLADHLRHLLRTYDLAAITRVVDRLRLPPRRAA